MKTTRTNTYLASRLPGYDRPTRRLEWGVFVSLGLAGAVLVGMATRDALRFAEDRDCIAAALNSGPAAEVHQVAVAARKPAATNASLIQGATWSHLPQVTTVDLRPKNW